MKKIAIVVVLIVVALFLVGQDMVVNPVQEWVMNNPKSSSAESVQYRMAGYLYMIVQRQAKAVELYETAFRLFPNNPNEPEARYRIALYCEAKRDYKKAMATYELMIQKWPDKAEKLALTQRVEKLKALGGEIAP